MAKTSPQVSPPVTVFVAAETRRQIVRGKKLAVEMGLDFVAQTEVPAGYLLLVRDRQLELHCTLSRSLHGPIYVDFAAGKAAHRLEFGGGRGQHLARAVGIKPGFNPTIIDATAGLGGDAFVFASLGCDVRLIEMCAPVACLLEDGLQRARDCPGTREIANRMQLYSGDALGLIPALAKRQSPDVIYLDPMYPSRNKSAAVKKEMQMLQALVGKAGDNTALLDCALKFAGRRVVVKRPAKAPQIGDRAVHARVTSANTRYDIYMPTGG